MATGKPRSDKATHARASSRSRRGTEWLVGGGELGELIRSTDWSRTALGPRDRWSQSLRTTVNLVVSSKFPMALLWGPELLLLYNDAYRVIAADKHPAALGRSTRDIWAEVWHINEPIFAAVMRRGETLYFEDKPFHVNRTGQEEAACFTLCYSPVYEEAGVVGGTLVVLEDTTERVRLERELRSREARNAFLLSLSDELQALRGPADQQHRACKLLAMHLGADAAHYGEHRQDGRVAVIEREFAREGSRSVKGRYVVAEASDMPKPLLAGCTAVIRDTETSGELSERARAAFRRMAIRALIAAPLMSDGKLAWTLSVVSSRPRDWTRDEVALVEEVGNRTWAAAERARVQAELHDANLQLAEADRKKTAFLGLLSHELRNPLAPIANSLYILDHAMPGGEQAVRAKEVIGRQVELLSHLVNELLEFTRMAHSRVQLRKERLDLAELVARTIDDHRALFEQAGVRLELLPVTGQIAVQADRNRIVQIVSNLLLNAAKFTPEGGTTRVSVETLGAHAVLLVKDDGIGMDPVTSIRVFEPFVQGKEALARSPGGLGIGLTLVKGLAELHGGTVGAHSDGPGKGSEFVVRLPLDSSPAIAPCAATIREHAGRRVLIIEDHVDAAMTLREALRLCGHEVQVASTGVEGLAMAREFGPEVLLCDIGLPGMDGYEVARAFLADEKLAGVFLVALSGYASPQDLQRAAEAGFKRHLAKPASIERIQEVLRLAADE